MSSVLRKTQAWHKIHRHVRQWAHCVRILHTVYWPIKLCLPNLPSPQDKIVQGQPLFQHSHPYGHLHARVYVSARTMPNHVHRFRLGGPSKHLPANIGLLPRGILPILWPVPADCKSTPRVHPASTPHHYQRHPVAQRCPTTKQRHQTMVLCVAHQRFFLRQQQPHYDESPY